MNERDTTNTGAGTAAAAGFGPLGRVDDPRCSECGKDHVSYNSPDWGVPSRCTAEAYRKAHPGALERAAFEMTATYRHLATMRRRRERRQFRRVFLGALTRAGVGEHGVRLFPHLKGSVA